MSGGLDKLAPREEDVIKFLACSTHVGTANLDFQMKQYVFKRKPDGVHIIDLRKTWEKILVAARAIAAIENPTDVCVISSRPVGQRAVLKFASYTGANPIAGRFTPGTFTNQIQAAYREPRLLVVTDPREDHQPVTEASYVNIPVVALCSTDSPMRYIDVGIPCNNKSSLSVGLMWWMLAREVLRLRGTISREVPWNVMVDLFFYRSPEETEKEEQAAIEQSKPLKEDYVEPYAEQPAFNTTELQWGNETTVAQVQPNFATDDWATTDTGDWASSAPTTVPAANEWGGGASEAWE